MKHIVQKGEHLSSIAASYGLPPKKIWLHPENAPLRKKRPNFNVLFEGDELFIPDRQDHWEPAQTDKRHSFKLEMPTLLIRIDIDDLCQDTEQVNCELVVDGRESRFLHIETGIIECRIPLSAVKATLILNGIPYTLRIGRLDPVEEESGQRQRLRNLGYLMKGEEISEEEPDDFYAAVFMFQRDQSLVKDGICGPKTQARLLAVHGC